MATTKDLFVRLKADTSHFEKGMSEASGSAKKLDSTLGKVVDNVKSFLIYDIGKTLVSGFKDAVVAGVNYNATLETSRIKWETLLGTQAEANKMLKDIEQFAKTTPFEKMGVEAMATQLHNAGFSGQSLFDQLSKFGDMAGAFGVQSDSLQEMVRQYAQVKQSGVAYTEDLNILQDRGIPIYKAIAEQLGINTADVKKWASEGKISSEIYQQALDGIAKGVEGGMQKQSQSFSGMISTLKDGMGQAMGILSQPIFDYLKQQLETVLPLFDKIIDSLSENGLMGTIQKFAPGIAPFVEEAMNIFRVMGETVGQIVQAMTDFWNEHSNWLMPLITFVWSFISGFIMSTIQAIGNTVQAGLEFIDGIINFFQNLFKGNFEGCWESIKQIFSSAIKAVWNFMQVSFAVNIPNMIKNFKKNFMTWIDDAWVAVKKFFSNGAKNILETAKTGFSNVLKSVIQYMKDVPVKIKGFMDDAIEFLKGINLFDIGKGIIDGLVRGIKNMGSNVVGAIKGVVSGAINSAKKALGINSPSKVFMQFGAWTGEGLAIGLDKEGKRVNKASMGLASSVTSGYTSNLTVPKVKSYGANASSGASSGVNIVIENFTNNTKEDVNELTNRIAFELKRRRVVYG